MIREVDLKIFGVFGGNWRECNSGCGDWAQFSQGDLWGKVGVSVDALI